jgi:hypothetical protein
MARHAGPSDDFPDTVPAGTLTAVLDAVASGDQSRADTLASAESNARLN